MKKIILSSFFILLSFSLLNSANSLWYWWTRVAKTIWDWVTWCPTDWNTWWWVPTYGNTYDSRVTAESGDNMYCQYWDWASPTWSVSYSSTVWTKNNVTVYIACSDTWWSGCKMSAISWWTISWSTYYRTFSSNTSWSITLNDIAWNPWTVVNYNVWNIDKTPPNASDITSLPADWTYLLANNSKNITITWSASWWSPITYIQWKFEDTNTPSSTITYTASSNILSQNVNISKVDNNLEVGNYRDYTYYITNVCDAALNCTSNIKNFVYHVYAWNISNITSTIVWNSNFNNGSAADWTDKLLTANLKDVYSNKIVQVKNALNVVIRNVTLKLTYNNTLHLNQLINSWTDTAVTADVFTPIIWSNLVANLMNYANGIYNLNFRIFAPTYFAWATDWRNFAKWNFTISNIEWNVSDIPGNISLGWPIDFQFKPIYYTNITWELSPTGLWFVEWKTQTGNIYIGKNWTVNPTVDWLYFVQTWASSNYFTWTWTISAIEKIFSKSWIWSIFISLPSFTAFSNHTLKTLFTLIDGAWYVDDIKNLKLNEYIRYVLEGKTITYLAWILNNINTQDFETLKIYWITNIDKDKQKDLIANQWANNIQNLAWEINKASLKEYIRKNAINAVKFSNSTDTNLPILNLSWNTWSDSNNWWKILWDILYYWNLNWNNVELWNWTQLSITWKKTIIIIWWNLYIKSNMINNSSSDILWIIVLKDDAWNWWKIYIDNSVQEIDAIMYSDKSIISYNEFYNNWESGITAHEIDWNIDNSVMQNQLYIYWTVFSENTIWWSRKNPPVCPFWTSSISGFICDTIEAQKYDFNYLRAGIKNKYKSTYGDYPVIIKYNSAMQSTPPPLFAE